MTTLAERITTPKLTATCKRVSNNPHMADAIEGGSHWKVTLKRAGRRMTVYFSMGSALKGEPEAADVLDCMLSDADSVENASSFDDWASEYGYDTDSRKAERTFKACQKQTAKLRAFLGDDYADFLWETERL